MEAPQVLPEEIDAAEKQSLHRSVAALRDVVDC